MDFDENMRPLREELAILNEVIAELEKLALLQLKSGVKRSTRGRKSMGAEERKDVSARMKKYWAGKRAEGPAKSDRKQPSDLDASGVVR